MPSVVPSESPQHAIHAPVKSIAEPFSSTAGIETFIPTYTDLERYADQISSATKLITAYCSSHGVPQPSFDPGALSVTLPATAPPNVLLARQSLLTAAVKVQQLAQEPMEYLPQLQIQFNNFACVHWLCHFGILSILPLHGSLSYAEVAAAANVPERSLRSIARMAMLSNLLCEPVPGQLAHNAVSATFATNPSILEWALFLAEGSSGCAAKLVAATTKWGATVAKNETAFNLAHDTELPFFAFLAQTPGLAKRFGSYMKNVAAHSGTKIEHVVNGFDWASLGDATVVDVGGSLGHVSIALATANPSLRFIVQDLHGTIPATTAHLDTLPPSLRSRITEQAHDFFSPQPVVSADVYLLRMILHDWPDAEALAILRNLLPALRRRSGETGKPKPTLIVADTVLPDPGTVALFDEATMRVRDLTMMQTFNSRERELRDWEDLFARVVVGHGEGRLVVKSVKTPFESALSILEVVHVDDDDEEGECCSA